MAQIVWADPVGDVVLAVPGHEQELIFHALRYVKLFPHMYPVRTKGRFRYRWFQTGNWLVYYRVVDRVVYVPGSLACFHPLVLHWW
jgi:hypothetical protein